MKLNICINAVPLRRFALLVLLKLHEWNPLARGGLLCTPESIKFYLIYISAVNEFHRRYISELWFPKVL